MKSLGLWCFLAIIFCSPFNIGWFHGVPMLHFDHDGMIWLVGMNEYLQGSDIMISGWPNGQRNIQLDSLLLLWTAHILQAEYAPYLFVYGIAILGLSLSAWSAQRLCEHLHPSAKTWSWTAGGLYGFQALSTVSILEGHVYLLWLFWIPLGWWGLSCLKDNNHPRNIAWVVGCWLGGLVTSAYIGLCMTLLYILYTVWHWRYLHRGFSIAGLSLLSIGALYSWRILSGDGIDSRTAARGEIANLLEEIQTGSSSFDNLVLWSSDADLLQHSLAPTLGWLPLLILLSGPWFLQRKHWLFTNVIAGTGLLFSMGPYITLPEGILRFPSPLYFLYSSPIGNYCHFPVRFLYLSVLAASIMMPSILQAFANRCPKRTWFLGAACIIEPLILNGLFIRQGYTPIQYPSVYEQTPNGLAILELVPTLDDTHIIEPLRIKNKICAYQIQHKRTLINECLGKYPTGLLEADLKEELLTPTSKTMWHEPLIGLGVGAIILHADLWPPSKRIQIIEHLNKRLGEPTDHIEGGEHLILWVLPTTSKDINIPATLQKLDGTPNSNQ